MPSFGVAISDFGLQMVAALAGICLGSGDRLPAHVGKEPFQDFSQAQRYADGTHVSLCHVG